MTNKKLLELIGEYGGLRDDAATHWDEDRKKAEVYMEEATLVFEQISKEIEGIPDKITENREKIYKIIDEMLGNPNEHGIYETTKCMNALEELLKSVRVQALGYAWSVACEFIDAGADLRQLDQAEFLETALKQLNKEQPENAKTTS